MLLKWYNSRYSYYSSKGFDYDLQVKPQDLEPLRNLDFRATHYKEEYSIEIINLPYAYFKYNVTLRLRVKQSVSRDDDETLWSAAYTQQFQTEACLPESAPQTDVGSFYIDATETKVRLYWHQLPYYRQNGPDFKYVIKQVERDGKIM